MMTYREYPPPAPLRPHVACLWTARSAPGRAHRVLPDNCIDILWQDDGGTPFAVGMMTSAILVPSATAVRTVAVRFRPGAARLFLGLPLDALTDTRAGLPDLWGRSDAHRLDDALWAHELADEQRIAIVTRELLRRLADAGPPPALASHAVSLVEASHGALTVEALADRVGVTRQHLAVQFRQDVGLSPKVFARICRFRRALDLLRGGPRDLAALAADCGYFDQSHLIRDFRDFADAPPGAL